MHPSVILRNVDAADLKSSLLTIGVAENDIMNASANVITYSVMYDNRTHPPYFDHFAGCSSSIARSSG